MKEPAMSEELELLQTKFEAQAEWRYEKAAEYPDDKRNLEAAELFDKLAATVADISPQVANAYRDHFCGRNSKDPLPAVLVEEWHLRQVGFHTHPANAEEFLRDLIEELRTAGEPQPLQAVAE